MHGLHGDRGWLLQVSPMSAAAAPPWRPSHDAQVAAEAAPHHDAPPAPLWEASEWAWDATTMVRAAR